MEETSLHGQVVHMRTSRGESRWLLVSASGVTLSGENCMLWAAVDITKRERMEAKLDASRALRAAAFDAAHNPMVTFDTSGRIMEFNGAAERVFRRARKDVLGHDVIETLAQPERSGPFGKFIKDLIERGDARVDDMVDKFEIMLRDGRSFECEISTARTWVKGAILWMAAFRDASAARAAARQIEEANRELERRVTARTTCKASRESVPVSPCDCPPTTRRPDCRSAGLLVEEGSCEHARAERGG